MMRFRYRPEGISGNYPPSLPQGQGYRLRPLLPIRLYGPGGRFRTYRKALADTGADDTVFPADAAALIGAKLLPTTGHVVVWRGTAFPLRFAAVELELSTSDHIARWPCMIAFTSAQLDYPLLGICGFFQYFEATFSGADNHVEITPARSFPGSVISSP